MVRMISTYLSTGGDKMSDSPHPFFAFNTHRFIDSFLVDFRRLFQVLYRRKKPLMGIAILFIKRY